MAIARRTALAVVGTGLGLAVAGGALVPQAWGWMDRRPAQAASYATGKAAKDDRRAMPTWLPDTATQVSFKMSTHGSERLLRATMPNGKPPAVCVQAHANGHLRLKAHWFPADTPSKTTLRCGQYNAVLIGNQFYAWRTAKVAPHGGAVPANN